MKYISGTEYNARLKKLQLRNECIQRKQKLKEEKDKYRLKLKLPTTSKLMAVYLFFILNVVLAYAMIAMWYFADLTYLGVLVTDVAAQVLTYFIYARKATAENTTGGITYDMALKSAEETITYKDDSENAAG